MTRKLLDRRACPEVLDDRKTFGSTGSGGLQSDSSKNKIGDPNCLVDRRLKHRLSSPPLVSVSIDAYVRNSR